MDENFSGQRETFHRISKFKLGESFYFGSSQFISQEKVYKIFLFGFSNIESSDGFHNTSQKVAVKNILEGEKIYPIVCRPELGLDSDRFKKDVLSVVCQDDLFENGDVYSNFIIFSLSEEEYISPNEMNFKPAKKNINILT